MAIDVAFVVLLVFSGWLAMNRSAIASINRNKLKTAAEEGNKTAVRMLQQLEQRERIQIPIDFFLLLSLIVSGIIVQKIIFEQIIPWLTIKNSNFVLYPWLIGFVFMIIDGLIYFIFGYLLPCSIGEEAPEKIYNKNKFLLSAMRFIFTPVYCIITFVTKLLFRMMGFSTEKRLKGDVTEEEILGLVDAGEDSGTIDESEKEMINNIFEFDNISVGDIATHRTDIVAVDIEDGIEEIKKVILNEKYSRIPVYRETIDNIIGVFHIKDVVKYFISEDKAKTFCLESILMQPYFVPSSKKTDELFEELQKRKIYMAIVIDEYGGTAGIVTMEDLLERIVGNIFDEYDTEEEEEIQKINANTYMISGTAEFDEVNEIFHFILEEDEDYDTLSGFLIGRLGRIPEEGEHPIVITDGWMFQVEKMEEKRIEVVRATRKKEENEENEYEN
ncbi:MAG: HlyC/CorC family transporter [Clostridiales bacterium]|nr:HlyC/CorC family transporter [Clostridiales bacterium]